MDCTPQQIQQYQAAVAPINLGCNLLLDHINTIIQQVVITKSNILINCQNGSLNSIAIQSPLVNGKHQPISNIQVRNCVVNGGIRISGHSINGQGPINVADSRTNPDHTAYTQSVAPYNVLLDNIVFMQPNGKALYLAPGVHNVTVQNSTFSGASPSVAIYMDAESGYNTIQNNVIATKTSDRELIAIDGSAWNTIVNNRFANLSNGGIFLYRNCGEGGAVRWQTPSHNLIKDNTFVYKKCTRWTCKPGIWISARQRRYIAWTGLTFCNNDAGYWPKGNTSSTNDNDMASDNDIVGNKIPSSMILNTEWEFTNHIIEYK